MQMGLNERKYDDVKNVSLLIMDIYLKRGNKRIYVKGLPMRSWILGKTKGYISFYDLMSTKYKHFADICYVSLDCIILIAQLQTSYNFINVKHL